MRLVLAAGVAGLGLFACAHTVTNEERLDGMTDVTVDSVDEGDKALRCRDTSPEVQIARDRSHKKSERLARYDWAIAEAKSMQGRFEEAFKKEPDLVYGPGAADWKRREAFCVEFAVTLKKERDRVELEADTGVAAAPKPAPAPVVEKTAEKPAAAEKPAPAPEKKVAAAEESKPASAESADEAFGEEADDLRSGYKKKAKVAKAKAKAKKSKKKKAAIATR